jgi:hypothetical protein
LQSQGKISAVERTEIEQKLAALVKLSLEP